MHERASRLETLTERVCAPRVVKIATIRENVRKHLSRVIASARSENRLARSLRPRKSANLAIRSIVTSELLLLHRPCTRFFTYFRGKRSG